MLIQSVIDQGETLEAIIDCVPVRDIPKNPDDPHFAAIMVWQAQGGVIQETAGPDLEEARTGLKAEWAKTVNRFIEKKPDGRPRYDQAAKDNLAWLDRRALRTGQSPPQAVQEVEAWITEVQADYYRQADALAAAETLEGLRAVDLTMARLEGLYGVEGTLLPDPDVYVRPLLLGGE